MFRSRNERRSSIVLMALSLFVVSEPVFAATGQLSREPDARIEAMKQHARGPFSRIRWFCNDGTVLPPKPAACNPHGGGSQHGEWSTDTQALREAGYRIATVYADLDIESTLNADDAAERIAQMVIERFLIRIDDGWIFRRAFNYRGALQEEGERAGAARLLRTMATRADWFGPRFLAWRLLAANLPHGADNTSAAAVRQQASALAERDRGFTALRNKIHIAPDAADAAAVRRYAASLEGDAAAYESLAGAIDALHGIDAVTLLAALAADLDEEQSALAESLRTLSVDANTAPRDRLRNSARLLRSLRQGIGEVRQPRMRLRLLDVSRVIESLHFAAASAVGIPETASRRELLALIEDLAAALYGTGLLSARQLDAMGESLQILEASTLPLADYRREIDYLARITDWGNAHLRFNFAAGETRLAEIEPRAYLFTQDALRGSPLFFFAAAIDRLAADADRLAGVEHRLFETSVASGLRALNPGLARGVLRDGRKLHAEAFERDGIYLLGETTAELPPVAGIVTAGAGNPLSHVQLLARNLGIPNVAVSGAQLETLQAATGRPVFLAVSGGGAVHLQHDSGALDDLFEREEKPLSIEPDLEKLNLSRRGVIDLGDLRASDSGRVVGPKAAKLGELKAHYPEAVADGVAIPFGVFRALLDTTAPNGGTFFESMVARYRALEALPDESPERTVASETLRAELYESISAQRVPDDIAAALRAALEARLGSDGSYGVFVRSDTNVEDLPGFTGAGLNLTVANAVGIESILEAIPRVWASPFTPRAYAWRQSLMPLPEHVYPAVLLLESVDADKSGVLVTQDLESGDTSWLSVAVNEGVGGAVDGQSAESLRIHLPSGRVRLLAQASAGLRRQINPDGGVSKLPASGTDRVLLPAEIDQLIELAQALPHRFPGLVDESGSAMPADIEFGFEDGALRLFQIRPFVDNAAARANAYLITMDPDADSLAAITVDLDAPTE